MRKVTPSRTLRKEIDSLLSTFGLELMDLDILEDDSTMLYILHLSFWDPDSEESPRFWDQLEELLPEAECICQERGANPFIILREEF